mgnify:CR=1 FL=1
MNTSATPRPLIAIACGGTGGHLFPGLAVAGELLQRDSDVMLLISPKEVDQQAVQAARDMEVVTLPAVGLTRGGLISFAKGFWNSYRSAKALFRKRIPAAVLAMGGFTSAPPVFAARHLGAKTFLHEANSVPGRANRWLAHVVNDAFVYFHGSSSNLAMQNIHVTGMPVRPQFLEPADPAAARMALGLKPHQPVLLVMGGSQGASGINRLVTETAPLLAERLPDLQFLHLTGPNDTQSVQAAYAAAKCRAVVRPFLTEMDLALASATVAISRAGASSLAELAALRVPAVLIPYPHAADDHQYYNALAVVESGAARMLEQATATPQFLCSHAVELVTDERARSSIQTALARWHMPGAASDIATRILTALARGNASLATGQNIQPASNTSDNNAALRQLETEETHV